MTDLILAIIVRASQFFRASSEKKMQRESESRHKRVAACHAARREKWKDRVTNWDLEKELSARYKNKDAELLEELRKTRERYPKLPITVNESMRILMANRHLLCNRDAILGIEIKASGNEGYERQVFFVWWINQKLIEGGVEEKMYIRCAPYEYPFGYVDYRPGRLIWEPMTSMAAIEYSRLQLEEIGYFKNAEKRQFSMEENQNVCK